MEFQEWLNKYDGSEATCLEDMEAAYKAGMERAAKIAESDFMYSDIDSCSEIADAIREEI